MTFGWKTWTLSVYKKATRQEAEAGPCYETRLGPGGNVINMQRNPSLSTPYEKRLWVGSLASGQEEVAFCFVLFCFLEVGDKTEPAT